MLSYGIKSIMLNVVMLNASELIVVMLKGILLSVVMLNVVAPIFWLLV